MDANDLKGLVRFILELGASELDKKTKVDISPILTSNMDYLLEVLVPTVQERISEFRDVKVKLVD